MKRSITVLLTALVGGLLSLGLSAPAHAATATVCRNDTVAIWQGDTVTFDVRKNDTNVTDVFATDTDGGSNWNVSTPASRKGVEVWVAASRVKPVSFRYIAEDSTGYTCMATVHVTVKTYKRFVVRRLAGTAGHRGFYRLNQPNAVVAKNKAWSVTISHGGHKVTYTGTARTPKRVQLPKSLRKYAALSWKAAWHDSRKYASALISQHGTVAGPAHQ